MHEEGSSKFADETEGPGCISSLSREDFASALRRALRHYQRLEVLEANPLLTSRIAGARLRRRESPETPAQALRESIREQSQSWGDAPKTAILEQALRLTYLDPMRSQQAVADTLNMSWSTYRRRLAEARELLTTQLWQMELLLAAEPTPKPQRKKSPKPRRPGGRRARFAATGLVGALVIAGLLVWHFGPWHGASGAEAATPSIAVLPFENLSTDPDNAYFSAGIQDEILTRLASIGSLKVISRTSTANYPSRPTDLRAIARQLGVTTILEGSVQKSGDEVHVNVQLIDARTQAHIWAKSYNRKLTKVFAVEGEVAQEIADALSAKLSPEEAARVAEPPTRNASAYNAFLKGQYYAHRAYGSLEASDFDQAIAHYRKAVAADPEFALAYARLSRIELAKINAVRHGGASREKLAEAAGRNAKRALALAPKLVEAHLAEGFYRSCVLDDHAGQMAAFKAALALNPHSSKARFDIGVAYENKAQFDKAIENFQLALKSDPENVKILHELGISYRFLRRYDKATAVLKRAHSIAPNSANVVVALAYTFVLGSGDTIKAIAAMTAAAPAVQKTPYMQVQRAWLAYLHRDYPGALAIYAGLSAKGAPSNWNIAMRQGNVEWAGGHRKKAHWYYEQAAKLIEPDLKPNSSPELHNYLGWIYARLGRGDDALEQMQIALKLEPAKKPVPHMKVLLMLAQVQAQLGHVDKAVAGLRRLPASHAQRIYCFRAYASDRPELGFDPSRPSLPGVASAIRPSRFDFCAAAAERGHHESARSTNASGLNGPHLQARTVAG